MSLTEGHVGSVVGHEPREGSCAVEALTVSII